MSKNTDRMKVNMGKVLRPAFRAGLYPKYKIYFWMRVFAHFRHETACMYFDEGRCWKAIADELVSILACPYFHRPAAITELPDFRLRHLYYFVKNSQIFV